MNLIALSHGSIDLCAELTHERELKNRLLSEARRLGPAIAAVVHHIWAYNVLFGYDDARQIIATLPHSYPLDRLESACARVLYYDHPTTMEAVRYALRRELDRLPLSPYTDFYGKLRAPSCAPMTQHHGTDSSQTKGEKLSKQRET
jgi:hypothetical protein